MSKFTEQKIKNKNMSKSAVHKMFIGVFFFFCVFGGVLIRTVVANPCI